MPTTNFGLKFVGLCLVLALFLAATLGTAGAGVILYDESASGDAGDESAPEDLGTLGVGTHTILGSLCFGGGCGTFDPGDAYCFEVPIGLQVSSGQITLTNVVGVGGNTRIRGWDGSCSLTSTVEDLGDVGPGTTPLTLVPYAGGATRYGPGVFFGTGTVSGDSYNYEWTFEVTEDPTPIENFTWGHIKAMHD